MRFLHKKSGHTYKLLGFAVRESDLNVLVLYRRIDDFSEVGPIWTRLADEFFDGRFVQLAEDEQ